MDVKDLKVKAYDLGKKFNELQVQAENIKREIVEVNKKIQELEKDK